MVADVRQCLTFLPPWPGLFAQRGLTSLFAGAPPQNAGDVPYDAAWGGTPKAHTKDPTPVSAENNSLGKKGAIASGESFEEYMKRRAAQAGKKQEVVQARPAVSSGRAASSSKGYSAMYLR